MKTDDYTMRYARHLSLPGVGEEGQRRLDRGSVLVIGAGGLGSPVLLYLAAAGVGRIGVADGDRVDLSNLQRQIAHTTPEVGRLKVDSAADKILAINPGITVEKYPFFVDRESLTRLVADYDFVIDATDSMAIKYLVDDVCRESGKPYNHGAISAFEGQTMTVMPGTVGFRDLFPDPPTTTPRETPQGPLGAIPGLLGTIQATEALKYLLQTGDLLTNRLLRFDALRMTFDEIRLR